MQSFKDILCRKSQESSQIYVSVNSKPDHPPGPTPGEIFWKGEFLTPGAQRKSEKPTPGGENRAKTLLAAIIFKNPAKKQNMR